MGVVVPEGLGALCEDIGLLNQQQKLTDLNTILFLVIYGSLQAMSQKEKGPYLILDCALLQRFLFCQSLYNSFDCSINNMAEQSQIVDLSGSSNLEILQALEKLLQENEYSKFTIVLTRKPKRADILGSVYSSKRLKNKFSFQNNNRSSTSDYGVKLNGQLSQRMGTDEDPDDNYHLGLKLYKQEEYLEALELLEEEQKHILEELKGEAVNQKLFHDVCFNIGNCYYRMKNYEKAIEYFGKKFQGEEIKQQGQKYNNLGSCYAHLDQERLSLNYFTQAFKIYSLFAEIDCSNLLNNLGTLYAQSGVYNTAQKYFLQSIEERQSKSPESYYLLYCSYMQLGKCQKNQKKLNDSIQTYKNALKISQRGYGEESETLMQLASIYEMCERWNDALNCYERLSVISSMKGFLYEKAAVLHRNMGHFSDYDRLIKQAFEEYRNERNQRKLSELRPVMARLTKK